MDPNLFRAEQKLDYTVKLRSNSIDTCGERAQHLVDKKNAELLDRYDEESVEYFCHSCPDEDLNIRSGEQFVDYYQRQGALD